jgi:hypothetical protein
VALKRRAEEDRRAAKRARAAAPVLYRCTGVAHMLL